MNDKPDTNHETKFSWKFALEHQMQRTDSF